MDGGIDDPDWKDFEKNVTLQLQHLVKDLGPSFLSNLACLLDVHSDYEVGDI